MTSFARNQLVRLLIIPAVALALSVIATPKAWSAPSASSAGLLCALVFDDGNGNGNFDKGDVPLPGQLIQIATAKGGPLARGATAKDGRYCTPQPLPDGEYQASQFTIDPSAKGKMGWLPPSQTASQCAKFVVSKATERKGRQPCQRIL